MAREHWLLPEAPYQSYAAYLAEVGSSAVAKARDTAPSALIDELKRSGLRGRGGAGFAAGVKWASLASHSCPTRYVVMNAAEGEPGTFKDRWLLRMNPYASLEGFLIAAHTISAKAGYIAIKASFLPELARLRAALAELEAAGVTAGFKITITEGPEEYLFGEEKALLNVIEGEGPLPRTPDSPPYEVGLFARPGSPNPALVNNAETFARVSTIVRWGAKSFRKLGTSDTPGPVLFTLSGDLARPGVYEREAGVPLRNLFAEAGGGPLPGRSFKAALSGVSSGVIPADRFDTPSDFGSLQMLGAGLGSAGFMLLDDARSIPRITQALARFLYVESCYQCSSCKNGLRMASSSLDELFDPRKATSDDPERALIAAQHAPQGNRCYLPVQGSILIPSLLRRFRSEFEEQIRGADLPVPPWPVPKFTDYDPATHSFTIDEAQGLKRPDWTYAQPVAPPSQPARAPLRELVLRLPDDLLRELRALAEARHTSLDREAEQALRKWAADRKA